MTESKRHAGVELLRILAMGMIVVMHFLRESDSLLTQQQLFLPIAGYAEYPGQLERLFGTFLESFCIVAVNAYLFISGYFGCKGEFQFSKCIEFLCQIWFYSLLVPLVRICLGKPVLLTEMGIYGLVQYVLPIESESYWFVTSYFLLMLLMPVLNAAVCHLKKKQFQFLLFGLLLISCFIKSICPVALAYDKYGYDLLWFLCVYLAAAYMRIYGARFFEKYAGRIYVGSCFLIFAMTLGLWHLLRYFSKAAYYFTVPFHYNFILCLTGAAGIFFFFLKLNLKEGKGTDFIRWAGKYSLGVYLFHEHPDIRHRWYPFLKNLFNPSGNTGFFLFLAELLFSVAVLFAAGLFIEWIRVHLFAFLKRAGRSIYAGKNGLF